MGKFYDETLKYVLPSSNLENLLVMNSSFNDWDMHVYNNLYVRKAWDGHDYSRGKDQQLLETCKEHRQKYGKGNYCKDVIFLTHPFYMHLTHMDSLLSKTYKEDADRYLDNLLLLLSVDRTDKFSIVCMDTIHCYAAATSLLLEQGKIDDVIFTRYDSGKPLDNAELKVFRDSNVYFGGSYNGKCLKSSVLMMREAQFDRPGISYGNLLAIHDLVLNSPLGGHTCLIPRHVEGFNRGEIVSLNETLSYLGVDISKDISNGNAGSGGSRFSRFLKYFQLNF